MMTMKKNPFGKMLLITTVAGSLFLGGCAQMNLSGGSSSEGVITSGAEAGIGAEPYYPTDFKDILVPAELSWNREKSMSIRTSSFAGGILNFSGRVEIDSLTNFFITSMQKDGWKLSGSIKYKNVLLAFTKPNKTSLINIFSDEFGYKTEVNIYVTQEMGENASYTSPVNPFQ